MGKNRVSRIDSSLVIRGFCLLYMELYLKKCIATCLEGQRCIFNPIEAQKLGFHSPFLSLISNINILI